MPELTAASQRARARVAIALTDLHQRYGGTEPDDNVIDAWAVEYGNVPAETLARAVALVLARTTDSPPTGREFGEYVAYAATHAAVHDLAPDQCLCAGTGWRTSLMSNDAWPCRHCDPAKYKLWLTTWVGQSRKIHNMVTPPVSLPYNPQPIIAGIRASLRSHTDFKTFR